MRRMLFIPLVGVLLAAAVAVPVHAAGLPSAGTTLRIAYPPFPPFHWQNEEGNMAGLFFEILDEALHKRMGREVVWTAYPWVRCQENIKKGSEDAIITVPTAERLAYADTHRRPLYEKKLHLFTFADHPRLGEISAITSLADIKRLGLSTITYSGNGWHRDHVESLGIPTHATPILDNVWLMLRQRRGDLVLEWPVGARPYVQRLGLDGEIIDTGIVPARMPFFLLVRKTYAGGELLRRFDETLAAMAADTTLASIVRRYE